MMEDTYRSGYHALQPMATPKLVSVTLLDTPEAIEARREECYIARAERDNWTCPLTGTRYEPYRPDYAALELAA